jgi:hypothetical protein
MPEIDATERMWTSICSNAILASIEVTTPACNDIEVLTATADRETDLVN